MIVTPATFDKAIAASAPGAHLVLEGVFPALNLKAATTPTGPGRKPDLTLDLTKAEIIAPVRTGGFDGLHFIGGLFRGGITLGDGRNFSMVGASVRGTEARDFNGVTLQRVTGARIADVQLLDVENGVSLSECADVEIEGNAVERFRKDVFNVFASHHVTIRGNRCRNALPQGIGTPYPDHGDAVQMWSLPGKAAVTDILIEGNDFEIEHGQGITVTWKEAKGDPRFANLAYVRNRVKAGAPYGYGMFGVDGGLVEDNRLEGFDSAAHAVRFIIGDRCTGIVWKGENVQEPHKGQPRVAWPSTVAKPLQDPRIAELEAALAEAREACAALGQELEAANARLAAVRAALA